MAENIPAMMSALDVGDKVVTGLGVADVGMSLQHFGWADYLTFATMLVISTCIGLYYGIYRTSSTSQDYLLGGRNMSVVPISFSLIASFVSGITILGIPTETYIYGIQYTYIIGAFFLMTLAAGSIYIPVFHGLKLTSIYEYYERRFDKKVRVLGSLLFVVDIVAWLPLVIYGPALAFNQVTGVNVHLITPIVSGICIFYTSLGGLKGVVWTDVAQLIVMFLAIIVVAVKGTIEVGGFGNVFQRNWEGHRIEGPNFDLDPLSRHTIWSLVIGGFLNTLQTSVVNQFMLQRYLSLPTLRSARRALWIYFLGIVLIIILSSYCGMLIYATFYKCDPLSTMLVREKDQLLPLLVMETLGNIPGLTGIFIAGIFGAALSSLSTGLNSAAAIVLDDFYKSFFHKQLSERQVNFLMKFTVVLVGLMCMGLVFVVEKLGTVLQLAMSVAAISNGASLGIFTMGMLLPWVNSKGALVGGASSLIFMTWLCARAQSLIASGDLTFPMKPLTTEGCHYHFTPKQSPNINIHFDPSVNVTNVTHTDERFMIYKLSYLWYNLIGMFVAIFVGLLVSSLTKLTDPRDVDQQLLAPFVRRLIKPRKFSNQPDDGIIYAYGPMHNTSTEENTKLDISLKKYESTEKSQGLQNDMEG